MNRLREQQTLLGLKDFLRQQLYDASGQPVPPGTTRELARIVDQRLRDVWAQNAAPQMQRMIESAVCMAVDQVTQDYHLIPKFDKK